MRDVCGLLRTENRKPGCSRITRLCWKSGFNLLFKAKPEEAQAKTLSRGVSRLWVQATDRVSEYAGGTGLNEYQ